MSENMERQSLSVLVTHFGGYDALSVKNYTLPTVKENEVEVSVYYCGVNFSDIYRRKGFLIDHNFPFVLGIECSGIITVVGKGNHGLKVGQKVVCYDYMGGLYRTSVVISAKKCYPIPDDIDLKTATALFVNYLTAYFCIITLGNVQPNQNILINSCAGGVGWAATQLARQTEGVVLYGTTSRNKISAVHANGIHHIIDYMSYKDDIKKLCPGGLDLIIDNQVGDNIIVNQSLLNQLGRLIVIGANNAIQDEKKCTPDCMENLTPELSLMNLISKSTSISGLHLGIIAEKQPQKIRCALNLLYSMYLQDKIKPKIDSIWPIENVVEATKVLQERQNVGKVLLSTGKDKKDN